MALGSDPCCHSGWYARHYKIEFRRVITAITGNVITIDEPLTQAITAAHSNTSSVWKYEDPNRVAMSGLRDITFVSEYR